MSNPFFKEWHTPFGIPPFEQIKEEHYVPAFDKAFSEIDAAIDAIVENKEEATFDNTIEAFERTGSLLNKVGGVFFPLTSSNTTDELQAIEMEIAPRYAAHISRVFNNQGLFKRVKAVYECRDDLILDADQVQLLQDTHTNFVRAGAALSDESRAEIQAMDEELAGLKTQFAQNILKDTNNFELVLDSAEEGKGLPESVLQAALGEGEQRGKPGQYVFTISRSSITPFLQFAQDRNLREKIYTA